MYYQYFYILTSVAMQVIQTSFRNKNHKWHKLLYYRKVWFNSSLTAMQSIYEYACRYVKRSWSLFDRVSWWVVSSPMSLRMTVYSGSRGNWRHKRKATKLQVSVWGGWNTNGSRNWYDQCHLVQLSECNNQKCTVRNDFVWANVMSCRPRSSQHCHLLWPCNIHFMGLL